MIIAQVAPLAPAGLHTLIAGLVLLLTICGLAVGIWAQFRRKPPIEAEFVSKIECQREHDNALARIASLEESMREVPRIEDFHAFREHVDLALESVRRVAEQNKLEIVDRIGDLSAAISVSAERRASELHDRVTAVQTAVARVEAKIYGGK